MQTIDVYKLISSLLSVCESNLSIKAAQIHSLCRLLEDKNIPYNLDFDDFLEFQAQFKGYVSLSKTEITIANNSEISTTLRIIESFHGNQGKNEVFSKILKDIFDEKDS